LEQSSKSRRAPAPGWDAPGFPGHSVQFYTHDSFLLEGLGQFVGVALVAGDAAVVMATKAHREGLAERLKERGVDLKLAAKQGRYLSLDAAETLSKFMMNGWPDAARFSCVIGNVITQLAAAVPGKHLEVAAFGEMVALLWAEGRPDAAIRLEQLWNELGRTHSFRLHCAYPLDFFPREPDREAVRRICEEHSQVIPAESYTRMVSEDERRRSIIFLQQKARALETEIRERQKVQQALQSREAELKDFIENAIIGMHWVARDGTILWANQAEMNLLGYTQEEYVGRHISEFHVDLPVIEDILERQGRHEELRACEARLRCKDGSIRHVRIDSKPFVQDGEFLHTRCFTTDITDKRLAEESSRRLAAIVESSDDAIASKDLNGVVTSWNAAAERIFGYTAEEIVGRPITLIIPPELQEDEVRILRKIRLGERIDHFETVRLRKNGERIDVSLMVSPVRDERGQIIGAAKIVRDITQRKKMEIALHTAEKLASVGRLAATVAHEINNPLEAITNLVYLAKLEPHLPENAKGYMTQADEELARLSHLVQQTLGFYRDDSVPVRLAVSELIENVLMIYERRFRYKNLNIEKRIEPGLTATTSQGELKQILSNLIANSIDASRDGGKIVIDARASRHLRSGRSGIRITVADDGTGISAENKRRLFIPFFTTKKKVGTGLGLWIAKGLLEKKGGHIRFRSNDQAKSGTIMSVFLPLESPATPC
jgi:PAS domain S-box-containing protein